MFVSEPASQNLRLMTLPRGLQWVALPEGWEGQEGRVQKTEGLAAG